MWTLYVLCRVHAVFCPAPSAFHPHRKEKDIYVGLILLPVLLTQAVALETVLGSWSVDIDMLTRYRVGLRSMRQYSRHFAILNNVGTEVLSHSKSVLFEAIYQRVGF